MSGRAPNGRGLTLQKQGYGHHRPPVKKSCQSNASRGSADLLAEFAHRFACGRTSARLRAGGSFLASGDGAADIVTIVSRADCCGSSGIGSACAMFGISARGRVSKTVLSGRLLADRILMAAVSGSAASARATGARGWLPAAVRDMVR